MANQNQTVEIDPQALKDAENLWAGFIKMSKVSIAATIAILFALWFFFIAL